VLEDPDAFYTPPLLKVCIGPLLHRRSRILPSTTFSSPLHRATALR
jgi:hypothetical protein